MANALRFSLIAFVLLSLAGCKKVQPSTEETQAPETIPISGAAASTSDNGPPAEASLPFTACSTVSPPSLGGAVLNVYCAGGSERKPFIAPYVRVNWTKAKSDAEETCSNLSPETRVRLKIDLELMAPSVINEAKQQLIVSNFYPAAVRNELFAHPYTGITLTTRKDNEAKVVYTFPREWDKKKGTRAVNINFPTDVIR